MLKTRIVQKTELLQVPACRKLTIQANVTRYTCNSLGQVLDDASVPVADRKPYPFHLFGQFDRAGGYAIADSLMAPRYRTKLFSVFVAGNGMPLFWFNPVSDIQTKLTKGDIVFVYVDDLTSPNILTFIVVSAASGGFASLVDQSNVAQLSAHGWGAFRFDAIDYTWENDAQLRQPLMLVETKFDGDYSGDLINPLQYRDPQYERENLRTIRIPLKMLVNQYAGLSSWLDFQNPRLQLLFELYI